MRTVLVLVALVVAALAAGCELRVSHTHTHMGQMHHQHDHEVHRGRRVHPQGGVLTPGQARRHERRAARRARWGW